MNAPLTATTAPDIDPGVVVITPVAEQSPSVVGTLSSMTVGAGGLAVHVVAEVGEADTLASERVWVMTRDDTRLVAFQAVARWLRPTQVELSGVTAPVEERRRTLVRSPAQLDVELVGPDGSPPRTGHTVDLSRGGCRVRLHESGPPEVSQAVQLRIRLGQTMTTIDTQVHRIDAAGHVVLRFSGVAPTTAAALDREVLSRVLRA